MNYLFIDNGFEKDLYVKALIIIANADGKITNDEKLFISERSQLLNVDTTDLWSEMTKLDELDEMNISRNTKMIILYDCITLGYVDGNFDELEKSKVYDIAQHLGINKTVVDDVDNWIKEYHSLLKRAESLLGFKVI